MPETVRDRLTETRRRVHRYPEPAWREFYTTHLLVEELERIGVDELAVGPEAYDPHDRMAVPDDDSVAEWFERARTRCGPRPPRSDDGRQHQGGRGARPQ